MNDFRKKLLLLLGLVVLAGLLIAGLAGGMLALGLLLLYLAILAFVTGAAWLTYTRVTTRKRPRGDD
ncbi:MAG: hypothetical protein C4524_08220 [Candidatus Zixiibacteriota bacterium]|nr:MAG: hypothetical protein C4524_08220 [candidate division Zixibacteria bacterium]